MKIKQSKSWVKYLILGLIILLLLGFIFNHPKEEAYDKTVATVEELTTYYSFTGNIEAKNKESVILSTMTQINDVIVHEGDTVSKDDSLFTTIQGSVYKSSIEGEVASVNVSEGEVVMAGTVAVEITDYSHLQVKIKVDEYDLNAIEIGKEVSVYVNAIDKELMGTITHVSKEAQSMNGISYFIAIVDLDEDERLKVGMSTEVNLINQKVIDAIVIPMSVLQFNNENLPYIYYQNSEGDVMTKFIEVGITDGEKVQILSGLQPGDEVLYPKTLSFDSPFKMMKEMKR